MKDNKFMLFYLLQCAQSSSGFPDTDGQSN